jgi:hypothetical protein
MITPSYGLTATERVLPRLALDWTTGVAQSGVDVVRAGVATFIGSNGLIQSATANTQRLDWTTGTSGLLVEESRTNALLNSLIDGTSLATQLVTVTAAARTFSFYGTGTVVLSGAHSATVVGTGAYPTRTTLTFTPSAGVLTLTVTGTVQFAQLETGAFATSFIPTAATAVTRNADVATMTGTNFSNWYNASQGSFQIQFQTIYSGNADTTRYALAGDASLTKRIVYIGSGGQSAASFDGSTIVTSLGDTTGQSVKVVSAYSASGRAIASAGTSTQTGAVAAGYSTFSTLNIGAVGVSNAICGWVQKLNYWPQRLTNAEVQAFSK